MARIAITDLPEDLRESLSTEEGEVFPREGVKIVQPGKWIDGGKYSYHTTVVSYKGEFYEWGMSRSGSYFTDYDLMVDPYVEEVEPVQRTITVFERKAGIINA